MENYICCKRLYKSFSFKRSCLFLFLFVIFIVVLLGAIALIIVFVVKPKPPIFSLKLANLDLYDLKSRPGPTLFVSSVITLTFNAQNPNKVGIKYSPSRFRVNFEGMPIGTIRVPGFIQPPHSDNVTVPARVFFWNVNASHVINEATSREAKNSVRMRVVGDVKAHVLALHLIMLSIKVSLECDINIDVKELTRNNELYSIVKNHMASLISNPRTITRACKVYFNI